MKEKQIKTVLEVLEVMRKGHDRVDAFHIVAKGHGVLYSTISSQCVRELGLQSVYDFDEFAKNILALDLTSDVDKVDLLESIISFRSRFG